MAEILPADFLELLECPETHQKLRVADDALLAKLKTAQAAGKLLNRAGQPVAEAPEAALVRQDARFAYLVVEEVPIMLIDEAVPLDQLSA